MFPLAPGRTCHHASRHVLPARLPHCRFPLFRWRLALLLAGWLLASWLFPGWLFPGRPLPGGLTSTLLASQLPSVANRPVGTLDLRQLQEIEQRVLPRPLVAGPPQYADLPEYYLAENNELAFRFDYARRVYEKGAPRPFRMLTLVAGAAGVGKTFLKNLVFSKQYPPEVVCRFDLRELYEQWKATGQVHDKPDLACGDVVLNHMPALRDPAWQGLRKHLESQPACFYVIDSIDEIHPDDYVSALLQIERFVMDSDRPFVHVVVLGRGLAFREYWQQEAGYYPSSRFNLYMLEPPNFQTTGDLLVSSWNYHVFAHQLAWKDASHSKFSLSDYEQWKAADFAPVGRFSEISMQPPDSLIPQLENDLEVWSTQNNWMQCMLRNLAGNGLLREILAECHQRGLPLDEQAVKRAYFARWLERDTQSDQRPSASQPQHLDLYLQLLESVAVKYLHEQRIDSHGFFTVGQEDSVEVLHDGRSLSFPVHRILNRSGLKFVDPRTPGPRRYRFEPIWLHRMLAENHLLRQTQDARQEIGDAGREAGDESGLGGGL